MKQAILTPTTVETTLTPTKSALTKSATKMLLSKKRVQSKVMKQSSINLMEINTTPFTPLKLSYSRISKKKGVKISETSLEIKETFEHITETKVKISNLNKDIKNSYHRVLEMINSDIETLKKSNHYNDWNNKSFANLLIKTYNTNDPLVINVLYLKSKNIRINTDANKTLIANIVKYHKVGTISSSFLKKNTLETIKAKIAFLSKWETMQNNAIKMGIASPIKK